MRSAAAFGDSGGLVFSIDSKSKLLAAGIIIVNTISSQRWGSTWPGRLVESVMGRIISIGPIKNDFSTIL